MTTIFVINAISSLLAAAGIGGWFARKSRARRETVVRPLYVTNRPPYVTAGTTLRQQRR